jgi:hypothetical protein
MPPADPWQFHHHKEKLAAYLNGTMDFYMFHMVSLQQYYYTPTVCCTQYHEARARSAS